jgi:WD40-like Beta Propeller Repeat
MTAVLKEDPPPLTAKDVSPALARIIARCLEKSREMRFQSARDLAFGLEVLSDTAAAALPIATPATPRRWPSLLGAAIVVVSLLTAIASWVIRSRPSPAVENPLADARFTPFTNWDGTEALAEISPDGRFVAFVADKDGEFDIWLSQAGTDDFKNLTTNIPPMNRPGFVLRAIGFSGDGADI